MGALGVVELERPGQRLQHPLGGAAHVPALQARVVGNAHAGQDRDLLAAQSGNATSAVGRQPGLLGRDPGAAGGQELTDLLLRLHKNQPRPGDARLGDPASTSLNRDSHVLRIRALLDAMTTEKKTWLITGAGRGMGLDIAKAALAAGHNVVATGRNPDTVAKAVGDADHLLVARLDVTSTQDAEAAVKAAVDRFGGIDVLVNNAASFYAGYFEELTPEQMDRQITTSLIGPMNVTRAVLPVMRDQRSGHVVTISSSAGFAGFEYGTAYAASKFGVDGWMESLAPEIEPFGIHTTVVNPGFFRTELLTKESTNYAPASIEDYTERNTAQREFWDGMNGQQGGDPAKLAQALLTVTDQSSRRSGSSPAPTRSRRPRTSSPNAGSRSTPSATCRPRSRSTRSQPMSPRRHHHRRLLGHRQGNRPCPRRRGPRLALLARRADRIHALADELGHGAIAIEADITAANRSPRPPTASSRSSARRHPRQQRRRHAHRALQLRQREEHRRMVETNLLGAMTTTEVFLDQLRDRGGDLVNISSVAGRVAPAASPPTRRPSGASTAGQRPCGSSSNPTSA